LRLIFLKYNRPDNLSSHLEAKVKRNLIQLWRSGKANFRSEDPGLERSCTGRILSSLTFIVVIFCLALWITIFLLLKDRLFTETLSGNIFTNLTCLIFFGGLATAIFVGAQAGNFLRRTYWRRMTRKRKQ
jgi:hypothetical protein